MYSRKNPQLGDQEVIVSLKTTFKSSCKINILEIQDFYVTTPMFPQLTWFTYVHTSIWYTRPITILSKMKMHRRAISPHQDFRTGVQGLFVFRNYADIEDSREDENEAGSRCGTCKDKKERKLKDRKRWAKNWTQEVLLNKFTEVNKYQNGPKERCMFPHWNVWMCLIVLKTSQKCNNALELLQPGSNTDTHRF